MQALRAIPAGKVARPVSIRKRSSMMVSAAARRPQQQPAAANADARASSNTAALAPAAALALLGCAAAPLPALADELDPAATTSPAFYVVALLPILIYGLFWVYRDRVNPKACS